jgi:hypothetical protein
MPRSRKLALLATATAMLALLASAPAAGAGGHGGALVVGDSLEELTAPYLRRYLPGVPLTVSAVGGYNSNQVFDLFEQGYDPAQSVVVFDGGTNDNPAYPEILAGNLDAVAAAVGDRCMVVPTIHGLTVNGIGNAGKNRTVEEFAASRPGTQTPDWAAAVALHPELLQPDDLHPTPAGADYRAHLIAQGILACLAFESPTPARPLLDSGPGIAPVDRIARRRSALLDALAAEAGRRLALRAAGRRSPLAALLTAVLVDA